LFSLEFRGACGCESAANQLRIRAPRAALAPVHSFVIESPEIGRASNAMRDPVLAIRGWPGNKNNGLTRDCGDWESRELGYSFPSGSRYNQRIQAALRVWGMRYLGLSELRARLGGRSRSSIYCDITAGRLPRPIRLGRRAYWNEAEIEECLRALAEARSKKQGAA
jgi:predicted DNA-binding transcriptional regulator AlpA